MTARNVKKPASAAPSGPPRARTPKRQLLGSGAAKPPRIGALAELSGARVLVVGLGVTGLSCVRYLTSIGCQVAVTDSRDHPPGAEALSEAFPDVAMMLGGWDAKAFGAADQIVLSPGVPLAAIASFLAGRDIPVCGDIELFAHSVPAPVVAITGSNGKSTVTALLGQMARDAGVKVAVGGNLGTPALDLLAANHELYVLELSSFQLETTVSLRPRVATVLNLSPDHLDRYPDMAAYADAKQRIFRGAEAAVVNRDDAPSRALADNFEAGLERVSSFGLSPPTQPRDWGVRARGDDLWVCRGEAFLIPVAEIALVGEHNLANALAALALGDCHGLALEPMRAALKEFPGLPHRCALVRESRGVRWIDDSKGTNPGATIAALEGVARSLAGGGKVVLIAGGDGKGADFAALTPALKDSARGVVLIGRDTPLIEAVVPPGVPIDRADDMEDAVARARAFAQPGDAVLLSPACASFDMFQDYRQRGRVFAEAVTRMRP